MRVGVQAMYCGQHYAGSANYHDAPSEFNDAVKQAIDRHKKTLVEDAYTTLLASLDQQVQQFRKDAEEVFKATECKGIEIEPGKFSGCDAVVTGAKDCPTCGEGPCSRPTQS